MHKHQAVSIYTIDIDFVKVNLLLININKSFQIHLQYAVTLP
jgi:hypothetical protein